MADTTADCRNCGTPIVVGDPDDLTCCAGGPIAAERTVATLTADLAAARAERDGWRLTSMDLFDMGALDKQVIANVRALADEMPSHYAGMLLALLPAAPPIIHRPGCSWETAPYCDCGADSERVRVP